MRIALRMVVEGDSDAAEAVRLVLRNALAGVTPLDEPTIRPYWKLPGTHEISGCLQPLPERSDDIYEEVVRRLGSGWAEHTNDRFARWTLWNRGDGSFFSPVVLWAHLELIRA